jgi:hypothetical protein
MKTFTQKLAIAALALTLPLAALAQPKVTASAEVWNKDIMSRGFILSQDPYLKPTVFISSQDGNTYGYMNQRYNLANGGSDRGTYIAAGKNFQIPGANLNVEVGQLSLPSGAKIPELYTATSFKLPLNPTIEAVVSGGKSGSNAGFAGNYFSGSVSQNFKLGKATASLLARVGYNDNYGTNFSGFSHASVDASVSTPVAKGVNLTAGLRSQYSLHKGFENDNALFTKLTYKF